MTAPIGVSLTIMDRDERIITISIKALLFGVSALVLLAQPSQAAERINLGVGGAVKQHFGHVSNDDNGAGEFTSCDVKSDSEIAFGGATTLENGLQFGCKVILKAGSGGAGQINDTYIWNEGDYGQIETGQADNAATVIHYAAPNIGLGIHDSDIGDWITNPGGGDVGSVFQSTFLFLGEDKASKVSWLSPRVGGLQLGLSYTPKFERDGNAQHNGDTGYRDSISVSLNYAQEFGEGTELATSGGFLTVDSPGTLSVGSSAEGYSISFNLAVGAFGREGSYGSTIVNPSGGGDTATSFNGSGFDIGVGYAFDSTTASLSYYQGEVEDDVATSGDSIHETIMASIANEIGPGHGYRKPLSDALRS
ncbi:MAG: porin [Alphaproteobacteria bacterium]|nr:porin [Alphaproteobacteria bacterium]